MQINRILLQILFFFLLIYIPYSLWAGEKIGPKDLLPLLPWLLSGTALKERKTLKRKAQRQTGAISGEPPSHLTPSLNSGLYGGLLGGALAGLLIGVGYYLQTKPQVAYLPWSIIPEIIIYGSVFGTAFGSLSQLTILWFRHLAAGKPYPVTTFNEISGAFLEA